MPDVKIMDLCSLFTFSFHNNICTSCNPQFWIYEMQWNACLVQYAVQVSTFKKNWLHVYIYA